MLMSSVMCNTSFLVNIEPNLITLSRLNSQPVEYSLQRTETETGKLTSYAK